MNAPETLIDGRYRLVRRVGSGAMGAVWEARDERLNRTVAVKMLHAQHGLSEDEAELTKLRAMREARITARLDHPYAVPVYDVVEHEGHPCLVMQYLPSTPLSALLKQRHLLPRQQAVRIAAQVASALTAAHAVGIVHRDVKPGNILIAENGTARISDFGISHALGDTTLTATGLVHGTPAYLAPEVALGGDSSFASDVYGLGGSLYAMLEGAPPFGTEPNAIALLHKVALGDFPPPTHAGELTPFLLLMLSRQPHDRPAMSSVAQTLGWGSSDVDQATLAMPDPTPKTVLLSAAEEQPADPAPTSRRDLPARSPAAARAEALPESSPSDTEPPPPPAKESRRRPVGLVLGAIAALVGLAVLAALLLPGLTGGDPPTTSVSADPGSTVLVGSPTVSTSSSGSTSPAASTTAASSAPPSSQSPSSQSSSSQSASTGSPSSQPASSQPASSQPAPSQPAPSQPASSQPAPSQPAPRSSPPGASPSSPSEPAGRQGGNKVKGSPTAAQLEKALTSYYALLPGDTDAGWSRLTSSYQRAPAGGRSSYDGFWAGIDRVSVSRARGRPPKTVEATVTYRYKSGRVVRERTSYQLVKDNDVLKINRSKVLSSSG